ncbi:hypothetical protein SEA_NIKE_97 [Microbacterium phage Nike]|nr:hypothetical protein SEA_NIKE_97 [Microbacterium phage Nike]
MTLSKHTKSTSGRTHRLTYQDQSVQRQYREAPKFDDQVQGDLWRHARDSYGQWPWPSSGQAIIDPALDALERDRLRPTPEQRAQQVLDKHVIRDDWRRTGAQIRDLIAEAIRLERGITD